MLLEDISFVDSNNISRLQSAGFPVMSEQQSRLILSLDAEQFVEMTRFAEYQIASEAYVYANLPMCMTEPLTCEQERSLVSCLTDLHEKVDKEMVVVKYIDEFVRDILSFYETQIVHCSVKQNQPLKVFLAENNFCDSSDPVFAALPSTITVRSYVSMRQRLHQIKLSLLFQIGSFGSKNDQDAGNSDTIAWATRDHCWLWKDRALQQGDGPCYASYSRHALQSQWRLWFEQALPGLDKADLIPRDQSGDVSVADTHEDILEVAEMDSDDKVERWTQTTRSSDQGTT